MKWIPYLALSLGIITAWMAFSLAIIAAYTFIAPANPSLAIFLLLFSILTIILGIISIKRKVPGKSIAIIAIVLGAIASIIFLLGIIFIVHENIRFQNSNTSIRDKSRIDKNNQALCYIYV
jgi:hypothetical protein